MDIKKMPTLDKMLVFGLMNDFKTIRAESNEIEESLKDELATKKLVYIEEDPDVVKSTGLKCRPGCNAIINYNDIVYSVLIFRN